MTHFLCTRERVVHSPTRGDGQGERQGASGKSPRGPRETDGPAFEQIHRASPGYSAARRLVAGAFTIGLPL